MFMWVQRAAAGAAIVLLAACSAPSTPGTPGTPSASDDASGSSAGPLRVVAGFYPLAYAAERVGGDHVEVTTLAPPGAEPHDLELTPQQAVAIREADVVLYIPGFQPAVDRAIASSPTNALNAASGITLLQSPSGGADPHVWLNPLNMTTMGDSIRGRLDQLRPAASSAFASGQTALAADMSALDSRWKSGTTTCANRDLVVSHEAFAYLAQRYSLEQRGISGLSPEAEPSPATVAAVADFVRANNVRTIYYETLVDPKVATVLAQETGAQTAVLDPVEGLKEGSSDTYITIMDANLASVVAGQPCS